MFPFLFKAFQFLIGAHCRRPMKFCFKVLDILSPVTTVPFRRPYTRTLVNHLLWHGGNERSVLWEMSFVRLQVSVKLCLAMLLSYEVENENSAVGDSYPVQVLFSEGTAGKYTWYWVVLDPYNCPAHGTSDLEK